MSERVQYLGEGWRGGGVDIQARSLRSIVQGWKREERTCSLMLSRYCTVMKLLRPCYVHRNGVFEESAEGSIFHLYGSGEVLGDGDEGLAFRAVVGIYDSLFRVSLCAVT